ncbi:hypothetical protein CHUAL_004689 [Chamberlinius hualienensis]
MDLPKAPEDQELRNIIDKLAQFVARNGIEFEQMTKNKQKDNPKFGFLFGGEHFNYYQYKVTTEQAILKQKQKSIDHQQQRQAQLVQHVITQQSIHSAPWQQNHLQQQTQDQIQQSERNLAAQHHVLMQQQQMQIDEEIHQAEESKLQTLATECGIDLSEADKVMQPIIDTCTKDSISAGKSWIFNNSNTSAAAQVIGRYLVKRVTTIGGTFDMKLHIVYLLNDVLHHCTRKNADELKRLLEAFVVPIFCTTCIGASEDQQQQKLAKLLRLWETNKYFDPNTIEQLKSPATSLAAYQANLVAKHANIVTSITLSFQSRYAALQKQHQDFVAHLTAQLQPMIPSMDSQKSQLPVNMTQPPLSQPMTQLSTAPPMPQQPSTASQEGVLGVNLPTPTGVPSSGDMMVLGNQQTAVGNTTTTQMNFTTSIPPPNFMQNFSQPPPGFTQPPPVFPPQYNQPPPNFSQPPPAAGLPHFTPDLTKPPPGFPPIIPPVGTPGVNSTPTLPSAAADLDQQMIMPNVPYYELPAGLMTTLVKLEDCDYIPLDPKELCLPPPQAPSERLLTAVELFYAPPSHDRPRNSDGWEQLGLYEFFKAKSQAKKKKDEDIREGKRPRSHSRSRSRERFRSRSRSPPRRRYKEEITPKPTVRMQPRSKSKSRSKSRSRSRSPVAAFRRSRSRSRSKSLSPVHSSRTRRRSASRSPTPPSFFGGNYATATMDKRLDESNKGHQLLKKMGWGGAGLGAEEQGMQDPISGGEVRDRQDQYKGIGINLNDPFENFRKSKGQAFINRMKARAEEKMNN